MTPTAAGLASPSGEQLTGGKAGSARSADAGGSGGARAANDDGHSAICA
jgi:hypothetical protein